MNGFLSKLLACLCCERELLPFLKNKNQQKTNTFAIAVKMNMSLDLIKADVIGEYIILIHYEVVS